MNIQYNGYQAHTEIGLYGNGMLAIQLKTDQGENITTVTCAGDFMFPEDQIESIVGIKDWSENTGIVEAMLNAGVIVGDIVKEEPTGFVSIKYYALSDQMKEEVQDFLKDFFGENESEGE